MADASKGCNALNMTLLTFENLTLIQSYQPLLNSKFHKICQGVIEIVKLLELARIQFWTSASSEGPYCSLERTFSWCTTGVIVDENNINDAQLWSAIPNGSESAGNCITLGLNKGETSAQLSLAACNESKSYMCQV